MKKLRNKKIKSQIVFIILVLASIFLLIINFIPTSITNTGLTTDFTVALSSDYSVYVNQSDPNMNYYESYPNRLIGNSCELIYILILNHYLKNLETYIFLFIGMIFMIMAGFIVLWIMWK